MNDPRFTLNPVGNEPNQFFIPENFRANGIYCHIIIGLSGVYRYPGYVFHKDRLQSIVTISRNGKYRKLCEKPGDIVDKDVLMSKDHRRPNDGIRQIGMDDCLLKDSFSPEIRKGGFF